MTVRLRPVDRVQTPDVARRGAVTCPGCAVLERRVAALERRIADGARSRDEDRAIALQAIAAVVRDSAFVVTGLICHGRYVDPALGAALTRAGLTTARRLGRWLRELTAHPIAGATVRKIGRGEDGAIWRLTYAAQSGC